MQKIWTICFTAYIIITIFYFSLFQKNKKKNHGHKKKKQKKRQQRTVYDDNIVGDLQPYRELDFDIAWESYWAQYGEYLVWEGWINKYPEQIDFNEYRGMPCVSEVEVTADGEMIIEKSPGRFSDEVLSPTDVKDFSEENSAICVKIENEQDLSNSETVVKEHIPNETFDKDSQVELNTCNVNNHNKSSTGSYSGFQTSYNKAIESTMKNRKETEEDNTNLNIETAEANNIANQNAEMVHMMHCYSFGPGQSSQLENHVTEEDDEQTCYSSGPCQSSELENHVTEEDIDQTKEDVEWQDLWNEHYTENYWYYYSQFEVEFKKLQLRVNDNVTDQSFQISDSQGQECDPEYSVLTGEDTSEPCDTLTEKSCLPKSSLKDKEVTVEDISGSSKLAENTTESISKANLEICKNNTQLQDTVEHECSCEEPVTENDSLSDKLQGTCCITSTSDESYQVCSTVTMSELKLNDNHQHVKDSHAISNVSGRYVDNVDDYHGCVDNVSGRYLDNAGDCHGCLENVSERYVDNAGDCHGCSDNLTDIAPGDSISGIIEDGDDNSEPCDGSGGGKRKQKNKTVQSTNIISGLSYNKPLYIPDLILKLYISIHFFYMSYFPYDG